MCYDVRYLTKRIRKYAEHVGGNPADVDEMEKQLRIFREATGKVYHTTAFEHWKLPVITSDQPDIFQLFQWGFIPDFVRSLEEYQSKYTTRYLNSRIETLFEEKLFNANINRELENPYYQSALNRRCLIMLDGYFDWHWQGKNSYNFHIVLKSDLPMMVAGIWRQWQSKEENLKIDTVSLVTTEANALCQKVHNKPKGSDTPRQLAILDADAAAIWMNPDTNPVDLRRLVKIYPEEKLVAFPVKKLFEQLGKKRISLNDESCVAEAKFAELKFGKEEQYGSQGSLF